MFGLLPRDGSALDSPRQERMAAATALELESVPGASGQPLSSRRRRGHRKMEPGVI